MQLRETRGGRALGILAGCLAGALAAVLLLAEGARAQEGLDRLVEEGLRANPGLQQERLLLQGAEAALREAHREYLPTLTLNARFSETSGNVTDLGRLVNPAFGALNQLLRQNAFPTNIDLKIPSRQETALRLTQPLFEPRIPAAWGIRSGMRDARRGGVEAAERKLAADIRTGALEWAKARRLVELYDSTLVLVNEVVRVQESLRANGKATPDQVLRARADQSETEQRRLEALRLADAARQSLNTLLGREVDAPLEPLSDADLSLDLTVPADSALALALKNRPELAQARAGARSAEGQLSLADAGYLPSLAAAVDWGVQGEKYRFGRDDDYLVASLVLQWNLFDSGRREAQRQQARADLERARSARLQAEDLVALDVRTSWESANVSRRALESARDRLLAARRTFELVNRRHANGAASFLELLDARTSFTGAGINEILTTYEYRERCAAFEAAAALYPKHLESMGGKP